MGEKLGEFAAIKNVSFGVLLFKYLTYLTTNEIRGVLVYVSMHLSIFYAWSNINRKSFIEKNVAPNVRVYACTSIFDASQYNTKRFKLIMCFGFLLLLLLPLSPQPVPLFFMIFIINVLIALCLFFSPQKCFKFFSASIYCIIHFMRDPLSNLSFSLDMPLAKECKHPHTRTLCKRRDGANYGRTEKNAHTTISVKFIIHNI